MTRGLRSPSYPRITMIATYLFRHQRHSAAEQPSPRELPISRFSALGLGPMALLALMGFF